MNNRCENKAESMAGGRVAWVALLVVGAVVMMGCQHRVERTFPPRLPSGWAIWSETMPMSAAEVRGGVVDDAQATGLRMARDTAGPGIAATASRAAGAAIVQADAAEEDDGGGKAGEALKSELDLLSIFGGGDMTPPPLPAAAALTPPQQAKFDAAGWIGLAVGSLLLLFGGEAVVVWLRRRESLAVSPRMLAAAATAPTAQDAEAVAHFDELFEGQSPLVFKLPQADAEADTHVHRRAA